jgi:Na+-driven multidrug efflux pump
MTSGSILTQKRIFRFWAPLAATWLMMAVEGPYLAAIIARLPMEKINLAAYGVAYALALVVEAPVIMLLSASISLVTDRSSFYRLRNFTYLLSGAISILMLILVMPSIFYYIAGHWIGLSGEVAEICHESLIALTPWPAAIGYRRFYQGVLIRNNYSRRVAYGTIIRMASMSVCAFVLFYMKLLPGAVVGATALSCGVVMEAIASRIMTHSLVREIRSKKLQPGEIQDKNLSYHTIWKFYSPLMMTSFLGLAIQPLVTLFVGQSRLALESLAVLPVVNALVFLFRALGLSFQEVVVALMGEKQEGYYALRRFGRGMALITSGLLSIIAFTPLASIWYLHISGLSPELTGLAVITTRILSLMPALMVFLSFQRGLLVSSRKTFPATIASGLEVGSIILIMLAGVGLFNAVGAIIAAIAMMLGRMMANLYLALPLKKNQKSVQIQSIGQTE